MRSMREKLARFARSWVFVLRKLPVWLRLRRRFGFALRIPTDLALYEKLLLYDKASHVPPGGVIVEIGSYLGSSAAVMAAGARAKCISIHCVDTWQNDAMSEGPRDTYAEFRRNTLAFDDIIVPLRGRAKEVADGFDLSIDLLLVDGDHSYEGCKRDLVKWLPKVKAGGLVILHDLGWAEGIQRAAEEELVPRTAGTLEQFWNIGWGVIQPEDKSRTGT